MDRVVLEKLIFAHLFKKFPDVYETGTFIALFTMPTSGFYPEPDEFSPHPHPLLHHNQL
jgi:hypothetical protein